MSNWYLYARASIDPNDHQNSVGYQVEQAGPEFASKHGIAIAASFPDNHVTSRTKLEQRPEGRKLLNILKPGDHVIMTRLDRMFRSTLEFLEWDRKWSDEGISGHSIKDGGFGAEQGDAMSRAMMQMRAVFAELERGLISERTREGHARNRVLGRRNTKDPGVGFKFEYRHGKWYRIPNEAEREWCDWMHDQYTKGNSIRAIVKHLESHGIVREFLTRKRSNDGEDIGSYWRKRPWTTGTVWRAIQSVENNWFEGPKDDEDTEEPSTLKMKAQ